MSEGSHKPGKGAGSVAVVDEYSQQGGGDAAGIRIFLQRRGPFGADFRCRNLGGHPPYGPGTGRVPTQVGQELTWQGPGRWQRQQHKRTSMGWEIDGGNEEDS